MTKTTIVKDPLTNLKFELVDKNNINRRLANGEHKKTC